MELRVLLEAVADRPGCRDAVLIGDPGVQVTRAVHDSRQVTPGVLFCCVPGARHDGHDHAPAAVRSGATALLCERPVDLGVPEVQVASVRAAMGPVAAELAGRPSDALAVIGVTGTNGKTTTTHVLAALLSEASVPCGLIGTLSGVRTTPEAPELQAQLADMRDAGLQAVAMEVSSHALDLHRVDGTRFRVAVFTNLSRDHLDHHGDMAAYFHAKARLFEPELCDLAVLNLDDPHGRLLRDAAEVPAIGYSLDDVSDLRLRPDGSSFTWRGQAFELALPGRFNVANALAALTAAAELGIALPVLARGLAEAGTVAGRFEQIDEGQPFLAAVDYAHTPDGLEKLLSAARELAGERRVIVVFGAGGDRDRAKRPEMGEAAGRLADVVILTTDNPRSEDPAAIMADVQHGIADTTDLHVEPDRRRAIALGVAAARAGDVLLVAGKGHETVQVVGRDELPFDDRIELRAALHDAGHHRTGRAS